MTVPEEIVEARHRELVERLRGTMRWVADDFDADEHARLVADEVARARLAGVLQAHDLVATLMLRLPVI